MPAPEYYDLIGIVWDEDIAVVSLKDKKILMSAYSRRQVQASWRIPTVLVVDGDFERADLEPTWDEIFKLLVHPTYDFAGIVEEPV